MKELQIIELLLARNEQALKEINTQYGKLCHRISYQILGDKQDAEECVNDTYLAVWNAIPPARPDNLLAFLCKIARNLSLKRLEFSTRQKRAKELTISLSELEDILPAPREDTSEQEAVTLGALLDRFLRTEKPTARKIFIRKYWFFDTVSELSKAFGYSESKIKSMLYRTRERLKNYLKKEGIFL